ncbi:response regulator [uncultured Clostridium sp.]|uniref:response regulator transcription factor n=1 Tax=uncultured Clostridium sp. TaxID=59620 RepID=UPI002637D2D5|nr:response regulator [uncultured Clostridium sp.]
MDLYRILIVDDEEEVREGIIKKIDWKEYGFEVVGDAENGKDALEKVEKLKPDIVFTDIAMPFMDGLELGKILKETMPGIKIIIFSGSDDFEYAQKAIKINVIEYILKPVSAMELAAVLKKVKNKLEDEYKEKSNMETLQKYYKESLPILREQFLIGAIEGKVKAVRWREEIKRFGLEFLQEDLVFCIIHFDNRNELKSEKIFEGNIGLANVSISKILKDIMEEYSTYTEFIYLDRVILISSLDEKYNIDLLIKGLNEVCDEFYRIFNKSISIGIGNIFNEYSMLKNSFTSAEDALSYRIILGKGKVIYIKDVEPDKVINLDFTVAEEKRLLNTIKISTEDEIDGVIDGIFKNLENYIMPLNNCKIYLMEIMIVMIKLMQSYNFKIEDILDREFNYYNYLENITSLDEVKEIFKELGKRINRHIKGNRINSSKLLIEDAKKYIHENFNHCELSVEQVCAHLHVSSTYFSSLFKKEVHMSFVNYLTEVRLEKAINLLNTTDDKAYMIALKVGYSQANYFSYVFRKKYGVAPSKYRKS